MAILSVTEWIGEFFAKIFGDNAWLATILISMIPMIELKGGIVFGRNPQFWGENALRAEEAFFCGIAGGAIVIVLLTFLLKPVFAWLKKTKLFRRFILRLEKSFRKKANKIDSEAPEQEAREERSAFGEDGRAAKTQAVTGESVQDARKKTLIKMLGVFLFVAIPLPLTGVWTGTAIAVFLELRWWQTMLAVFLGNIVAGSIIMLVSQVFFDYLDIVFYIILAIVLLIIVWGAVKMVLDSKREKKNTKSAQSQDEDQ